MTILGLIAYLLFTPTILVVLSYAVVFGHDRLDLIWFVAFIVAINAVAFLFYGYDKLAAIILDGLHLDKILPLRVPELLLVWMLAFPGGSPAAILAMFLFRHKIGPKARDFRLKLLRALAVQVLALVLLALLVAVYGEDVLHQIGWAIGNIAMLIVQSVERMLAAIGV